MGVILWPKTFEEDVYIVRRERHVSLRQFLHDLQYWQVHVIVVLVLSNNDFAILSQWIRQCTYCGKIWVLKIDKSRFLPVPANILQMTDTVLVSSVIVETPYFPRRCVAFGFALGARDESLDDGRVLRPFEIQKQNTCVQEKRRENK